MRCALVIPAWSPAEIFPKRTAASQINYWQPLGTLYVAATLRQAGHDVRFFNGAFLDKERILSDLSALKPSLVGLYATAFGWPKALQAANEVRGILPSAFIVAGGPYPSWAGADGLAGAPGLDGVVMGEGEDTMVELAERLEREQPLDGVAGLVFRRGAQVVANPARPPILDLDRLPFPARDLLGDARACVPPPATYRRAPVAVMITSRGCNRRCIFCFQMDRDRRHGIRCRSVDNVILEIRQLLAEGYREIKFLDDTLAADRGRALEIARRIRAERLDVVWFASACVHQVDRELLEAFRAAGCWAILLGAESGVQRNLDALRKGITLEQTRRAVRAAKAAGLAVHTPFLFGIPGQTWEDGLESIRFAIELDPQIASFHALTPFPGSELWERRHELGTVADDLQAYTYQGAAFVPHTLTREQIQQLRHRAYRAFYSRPGYLLRRTLRIRSLHEVTAAWRGARSLLAIWTKRGVFRRDEPGPWGPPGGGSGHGGG